MRHYIITLLLLVSSVAGVSAGTALYNSTQTEECLQWVDSVMKSMTMNQRIAQLFVPTINPKGGAASDALVKNLLGKNEMGGLLMSAGSLEEYARLISLARKVSKVAPLITFDGEWGLSMRIKTAPRFPHNMGLGAIRDTRLLYDYGREVGREMRLLGVNVNFAPVLDVNVNPSNPVIGYRSFGENPLKVANAGAAYAAGIESAGVLAVGKHFPGHGDTSVDSHKALPVVCHSVERLEQVDLIPFEKFISNGGNGIMTGHLNVPALDKSGTPASLSKEITTGLLRNKMGFKGLIFTDALAMKGAGTVGNNCVAALKAGADMLLTPMSPAADLKAVETAVRNGEISKEMIDEKCRRVLAYKYALGLNNPQPIRINTLAEDIESPESETVNQALANASMTLLRDAKNLVPLKNLAKNSIAIVNIGGQGDRFVKLCRKYAGVDIYHGLTDIASIKKHDIVVVALYSDSQSARSELARLKDVPNLVEVYFINPYKMAKFAASITNTTSVLLAYDNTTATQTAAAQALFGGIEVNGLLPVTIKPIATAGTGLERAKTRLGYSTPLAEGMNPSVESRLDSLIDAALQSKAIPGGQLLVAKGGNVVIDRSFGKQSMNGHLPVTDETLYDLASVSKATGTLPGVMKAYDLGLFDLDAPASEYIPGLKGTDKETITVRELLYHESGIQPSLNMYEIMMDSTTYTGKLITPRWTKNNTVKIQRGAYGNANAKVRNDITSPVKTDKFPILAGKNLYVGPATYDTIMGRIYNSPLRKNKSYAYSCLNFCLLMDMEQRLTGISHDRWMADSVFGPLGCDRAGYRPIERFTVNEIASTEHDPYLRKQTICGYVHDELADMSGGVQGNAGLFSNAGDLAKLCQMWLNGGVYGDARILSKKTVDLFTKSKSPTCRRGLGFDKPDKENEKNSPTCCEATASAYGHLGFTGTVFWVDPDNELIFIFLNNRVNPTRDNSAFSSMNLRPDLFSEIYKSLER